MSRDSGPARNKRSAHTAVALAALLGSASPILFGQEHRLGNGARVIVESRPWTDTVAVRLVIGGGELDLSARPGAARLHAAMLLRGTKDRDASALARAAAELGGHLTATARPLAEVLSLSVPAANAAPAARLVVDAFLSARLADADLEKEKRLALGELATQRDDPSTARQDEVDRALFTGHPLSRLALPSREEIESVQLSDITAFHQSRMQAARIALLVVGHCDEAALTRLGGELLAGLASATSPREGFETRLPAPAPLTADIARHVSKRTAQAEMTIAIRTDGISDAEVPIFDLLSHVLGGFQERLYEEIREKRGWAYSIDARGQNFPGAGIFEVTVGAPKEHLEDIERIVRQELARIASRPVARDELSRALAYRKTAEARRDETNVGRAGVLTQELIEGAPLRSYDGRIERLRAVGASEIQQLARRLFAGKHLAVITLS